MEQCWHVRRPCWNVGGSGREVNAGVRIDIEGANGGIEALVIFVGWAPATGMTWHRALVDGTMSSESNKPAGTFPRANDDTQCCELLVKYSG